MKVDQVNHLHTEYKFFVTRKHGIVLHTYLFQVRANFFLTWSKSNRTSVNTKDHRVNDLMIDSLFLEGKEILMPGEDANINLRMNKQMTLKEGQQFTLRGGGATIASGKVRQQIR